MNLKRSSAAVRASSEENSKLFVFVTTKYPWLVSLALFPLERNPTIYAARTEQNRTADLRTTLQADHFQSYPFKTAK